VAPVNEADTMLLPDGLNALKHMARLADLKIKGAYLNLDGGFDSRRNRKAIFNAGLVPTSRRTAATGRPRSADGSGCSTSPSIRYDYAWSAPSRGKTSSSGCCCFEFKQQRHYRMKLMAYTLINLRHFCGA
jgi:hypothetical protein